MSLALYWIVGVVLGFVVYWALRNGFNRERPRPFMAVAEYWVYLPGTQLPEQEKAMTLMVARNPYAQGGHAPIGPREGILFSDIRLSVSLVLRAKNAHVFRPDVFGEAEASAEHLAAIAGSQSLVKIRYLSEERLPDARHLQFLIHMADAYARLGDSRVIYDVVAERLLTIEELREELSQNIDATRADLHVRIAWSAEAESARAETKGLKKKGLAEMVTADAPVDNHRLVCDVLSAAAEAAWNRGEHQDPEIVEYFDDHFEVRKLSENDVRLVHILRFQEA